MVENTRPKIKKILFYAHSPRAFRTTLIGHLYEISQVYSVVLLSEKLDLVTEKALTNKELFPKLERIIPVHQHTGQKMSLLSKNKYLCKLAKNAIEQYHPDIVISASDMHSLFELYLFRFSKRINNLKITLQFSNALNSITGVKWIDLINAYLRFPSFLPLKFRLFLTKCRKYLGHFLYYWILPLLAGEEPFFGKSSYILRKGNSGMRDADYQIVFSKRDYDTFLKAGVPAEKLYILPHPLARETKEFFEKIYFKRLKKHKKDREVVALMLPTEGEFGFRRKNCSLISKEEREENWTETIKLINETLSEWKIFIKPHPDTKNINKVKERLESISKNIEVVNPQESADKYIEIADVIIGLPLSASTTLFTASLQCPQKPIISLDFHHELLGDVYKNFEGVEYINSEKNFINILESIRDNKYQKKYQEKKGKKLEPKEFSNTLEMLKYLFHKKKN